MKLSKFREVAQKASGKTSEINRKLAFAGIAVCWIFRLELSGAIKIPNEITLPLILFVLTLGIDLFQYILKTAIWSIFWRRKEKIHKDEDDPDVQANEFWANLLYFIFGVKILTNLTAYVLLLKHLINTLLIGT